MSREREISVSVIGAPDVDYVEHHYAGGLSFDGTVEGGCQDGFEEVLRLSRSLVFGPLEWFPCTHIGPLTLARLLKIVRAHHLFSRTQSPLQVYPVRFSLGKTRPRSRFKHVYPTHDSQQNRSCLSLYSSQTFLPPLPAARSPIIASW